MTLRDLNCKGEDPRYNPYDCKSMRFPPLYNWGTLGRAKASGEDLRCYELTSLRD